MMWRLCILSKPRATSIAILHPLHVHHNSLPLSKSQFDSRNASNL